MIKYSNEPGLRPYFLTTAKKIKDLNPDVIIEKRVIPTLGENDNKDEDLIFEILVDDKVVIGRSQLKWHGVSRIQRNIPGVGDNGSNSGNGSSDNHNHHNNDNAAMSRVFGLSVYISMKDVNEAIAKARRKRRPNTAYAEKGTVGLQILSE